MSDSLLDNKQYVSRVISIKSVHEFLGTWGSLEKKFLIIMFFISNSETKRHNNLFAEWAGSQDYGHIEFAQVDVDFCPDIRKAVELGNSLPEYRLYEGKEIVLKSAHSDLSAFMKDVAKITSKYSDLLETRTATHNFYRFPQKIMLILKRTFGMSLLFVALKRLFGNGNKIHSFHYFSSNKPPYFENFVLEDESLYVPTGQRPLNLRIQKIDGSLDFWTLDSEFALKLSLTP
jgi:hypothetical protein